MRGTASSSGAVQIAVSMIAMSLFVDIGGCSSGVSNVWCETSGSTPLSISPVDSMERAVHFLMDVSGLDLHNGIYIDGLRNGSFGLTASAAGGECQRNDRNDRKVE